MKKVKYILTSIIFILMLFVPAFALVGCAKHFKVNIAIVPFSETELGGEVVSVTQLTHQKKSLVGENDVEQGSKFEYSVVPSGGFVIDYIKVDGRTLEYGTDYTTSALNLDETYGIARLMLSDNIQESHNVEVKFKKREFWLVSYEYYEYDAEEETYVYKKLLNNDGTVYAKQVDNVDDEFSLDITGYYDFGMKVFDHSENDYVLVPNSDHMVIGYDTIIRAVGKSKAELKTFLGL